MPRNADFLTALSRLTFSADDKTALNNLIQAGTNETAFRAVIIANRVFWGSKGFNFQPNQVNDHDFLNDIQDLFREAVKKRLLLGMQAAADSQLLALIAKGDPIQIRRELVKNNPNKETFGDYSAIPDLPWADDAQNIIADDLTGFAHRAARRTLLLKKIEASNDGVLIDNLLNANTMNALNAAALALGAPAGSGNPDFQDYIESVAPFFGWTEIKRTAARKGIILQINNWPDDRLRNEGFQALNENNSATFMANYCAEPAKKSFNRADIPKVKGALGVRVINNLFITNPAAQADLIPIAIETDPTLLEQKLNKDLYKNGGDGAYLHHVVAPETMPSLRLAAASQVLKQAIAQCEDIPTLEALVGVRDVDGLKRVLERQYTSLGLPVDANFRDAFTNAKLNDFLAAAHIRKSLVEVQDREKLKELALNPPDFINKYKQAFPIGAHGPVGIALDAYFDSDANKDAFRREALTHYVKAKLSDKSVIDDAFLDTMVAANAPGSIRDAIAALLGNNGANNLIKEPLEQELRQYAAAEQVVRSKKALDLSNVGQRTELINAINDLNTLPNNQRNLVDGLPAKEKNALKVRLVDVLIANYKIAPPAASLVHLINLAKAISKDEFNRALRAMGINEHSWYTEEARTAIQQTVFHTAIKLQIDSISPFDGEAHSKLFAFIKTLTFDQQKGLFERPEVVQALTQAQDVEAVKRIIGDDTINAEALIDENKQLGMIAKIQNAALAKALANVKKPRLKLNEQAIREINEIINVAAGAPDSFAVANYIATVTSILVHTGVNRQGVAIALGLNGDEANFAIANDQIRQNIKQQRDRNANLLVPNQLDDISLASVRPTLKAVIGLCLRLNKQGVFTIPNPFTLNSLRGDTEFAKFYTDFVSSTSRKDFLTKADGNNTYKNKLHPSWKQQLTPQVYNEVKRQISRQEFQDTRSGIGNKRNYQLALDEQKTRTDEMAQRLSEIESRNAAVVTHLKSIANAKSIEWLNPGFQASAKQNGKRIEAEFNEFAVVCDTIITQCNRQIVALNEELNRLPTTEQLKELVGSVEVSKRNAIEARRLALTRQLRKVEAQLALYTPVERLLMGNPESDNFLMRQGIVETLAQINEGKKDISFVPFHTQTKSYPLGELEQHLEKGYNGLPGQKDPVVMRARAGGGVNYQTKDVVEAGHFCEHTMTHIVNRDTPQEALLTSHFIEEREAGRQYTGSRDNKGHVSYSPNIKLTASQFPTKIPPSFVGQVLKDAQLEYSMAMATQLLAGMGEPPSKTNKISLGGADPVAMRYLWSALITLGQDPNFKFGADAIEVVSMHFNPDNEQGNYWGFKDDSLYVKEFKNNPKVKMLANGLREVSENKIADSGMIKDVGKVTARFRDELSTQKMKTIRDKNIEEDDTAPKLH